MEPQTRKPFRGVGAFFAADLRSIPPLTTSSAMAFATCRLHSHYESHAGGTDEKKSTLTELLPRRGLAARNDQTGGVQSRCFYLNRFMCRQAQRNIAYSNSFRQV